MPLAVRCTQLVWPEALLESSCNKEKRRILRVSHDFLSGRELFSKLESPQCKTFCIQVYLASTQAKRFQKFAHLLLYILFILPRHLKLIYIFVFRYSDLIGSDEWTSMKRRKSCLCSMYGCISTYLWLAYVGSDIFFGNSVCQHRSAYTFSETI